MARVVVLGANGQLGSDLCPSLCSRGYEVTGLTHADVDVRETEALSQRLDALAPDIVINTTAFHDVDLCERQVENAFAVNCFAVRALAQTCDRLGAALVHLSSDYVFDGAQRTPYREDSPLRPLNAYGVSKAAGEYFVRQLARRHLLVRTCGLYGLAGASGKGRNFVETMLRLGQQQRRVSVVNDQIVSPTYTVDLSAAITQLVASGAQGVFHVTNAWAGSWYEFARRIFELAQLPAELVPVTSAEYGSSVARPAYSVLDNERLRRCRYTALRTGDEALAAYLGARAALSAAATKDGEV